MKLLGITEESKYDMSSRASRKMSLMPGNRASYAKKEQLLQDYQLKEEAEKRMNEDQRLEAMEELNQKGEDASKVVVMPKYRLDERLNVEKEFDQPPSDLFIALGWDEDSKTQRKHYR